MAVLARAFLVSPESDQKQAEVALRFEVGDVVECYMDGCFHRGTVVALNHHKTRAIPVRLRFLRVSLLALYQHQNHRSYVTPMAGWLGGAAAVPGHAP